MSSEDQAADDAAPGWDAITAATDRLYPAQEPRHVGTLVPWALGGPDPLTGISAWKRTGPVPHWHYLTYGFSELYEKESDDPEISGYGFELTFRLACDPLAEEPPAWVYNMLQNIARYVFKTGNVFDDGQWMNANGPIARDDPTLLESIGFLFDPELPAIDTPNGRLAFLQMVGLTVDEERAAKQWSTRKLLEALLPAMPLWVTDLARPSLLDRPEITAAVREGTARDGSSTGMLYTETLAWTREKRFLRPAMIVVEIGAAQIEGLLAQLQLRLPFGKPLRMVGGTARLAFAPGTADLVEEAEGELRVQLKPATLDALARTLQPKAGSYSVQGLDSVRWDVRQSTITDGAGKVVQTIG